MSKTFFAKGKITKSTFTARYPGEVEGTHWFANLNWGNKGAFIAIGMQESATAAMAQVKESLRDMQLMT